MPHQGWWESTRRRQNPANSPTNTIADYARVFGPSQVDAASLVSINRRQLHTGLEASSADDVAIGIQHKPARTLRFSRPLQPERAIVRCYRRPDGRGELWHGKRLVNRPTHLLDPATHHWNLS